jgi:hypothetical protein
MRFMAVGIANSGGSAGNVDGYNATYTVGVDGWDAQHTWADSPYSSWEAPVCKNPATGDVFLFNTNYYVYKWTQASNTWARADAAYPPTTMEAAAIAYDSTRNRIFLLGGQGPAYHTFDPATGLFTEQTLTGAYAAALIATSDAGMVYEEESDAYLVRLGASGGALYSVDADTFVVTLLSTTGGGSIPVTSLVSGEAVYNKLLYAPSLSGAIYFPDYAANGWFLRTH